MATATRTKSEPKPAAQPITFDEIAQRRTRERLTAYRELIRRNAAGEILTVEEMEQVLELLDVLGLPQWAHERDVQAMQRFKIAIEKYQAAIDKQPAHAIRANELAAEIETAQKKLVMLREQLHHENAKWNKPTAYDQTIKQLQSEHPHVLADLDLAVRLRTEELDRRKRSLAGGAV
jgi:hypothetical protein